MLIENIQLLQNDKTIDISICELTEKGTTIVYMEDMKHKIHKVRAQLRDSPESFEYKDKEWRLELGFEGNDE